MVLDKLIIRDRKLTARKRDSDILTEMRKPQEDSEIMSQKEFPTLERVPGLKLTGKALADLLMVFEFLHNFGETLGFGKDYEQEKNSNNKNVSNCNPLQTFHKQSIFSLNTIVEITLDDLCATLF